MDRPTIAAAFATAVMLAAFASTAAAQDAAARDSGTKSSNPKTLFEALWGYTGDPKDREDDRIDPDRPHFPEASTTVGLGRAVLEGGYTFNTKQGSFSSHSAPESLLRVGVLADWFEFRIGQNFVSERRTIGGMTTTDSGAQDLYLGVKLALTEQKGFLPEMAVIPQMTVPTGSSAVTAGAVLPGLNVDCSWNVVKDFFTIELLVANNFVRNDTLPGSHFELATGLTGVFQLTKQLEGFVEWDAFYPAAGSDAAGPRHYAVGGLVYFITSNLAVDARVGVGLNNRSNDFLAGVGFAVRY